MFKLDQFFKGWRELFKILLRKIVICEKTTQQDFREGGHTWTTSS